MKIFLLILCKTADARECSLTFILCSLSNLDSALENGGGDFGGELGSSRLRSRLVYLVTIIITISIITIIITITIIIIIIIITRPWPAFGRRA